MCGRGVGGAAFTISSAILLYMKRFNETEFPIFVFLCVLFFKCDLLDLFKF